MPELSRRTFLKTSAAITAASTGIHAAARAQAALASPNERIGVGIIGCRNQGTLLGNVMLSTGQFDVLAVCDCDTEMSASGIERMKDHENAPTRTEQDFRRVLDDPSVDAVVLAVPDHWHALMTCMALDAGKHVYVEKPASYNIADGKAMLAAQARHPELQVQVGTMQRSGAHFKEAREFLQSGALGKIAFARAMIVHERGRIDPVPDSDPPENLDYEMWLGPAPFHPYNEARCHYNWHWVHDFGTGEMGNWGAHWIDILLWFLDLGYPETVTAAGGQLVTRDIKEWPDTQTVLYQYPDLTLLWELRLWSRFGPGGGIGNGCEFCGDKGALVIDRGGWRFIPRDGEPERHEGSKMNEPHAENFAASIRGLETPISPLIDGHRTANLCHLGNISVRLNRQLKFDGETETIAGDEEAQAMTGRAYREPWRHPGV